MLGVFKLFLFKFYHKSCHMCYYYAVVGYLSNFSALKKYSIIFWIKFKFTIRTNLLEHFRKNFKIDLENDLCWTFLFTMLEDFQIKEQIRKHKQKK